MFPTQNVQFTKGAVLGLKRAYETYLTAVASNLAQHDSLNDEQVVAECLSLNNNPDMAALVQQAQAYLANSSANDAEEDDRKMPASKSKRKRLQKQKITADMEAEQERLFQQSKAAVMGKMADEERKQQDGP